MIKRLFQIALPIVMAWLMVMPLSAQGIAFGVKGGLEVVSMEFNDDVFDKTNRAGFFIGPTFVISTTLPGLAIDISGLYNEHTLKVEGESLKEPKIYSSTFLQGRSLKLRHRQGHVPSKDSGREFFLISSSFWWPQVSLYLWLHHSTPCSRLHMSVFPLHLPPSPSQDTRYWISGPPD